MILKCDNNIILRSIDIRDTENVLKWRNSEEVKQYFIYQKEIRYEDHVNWLEQKVSTGKVVQFIIEYNGVPIGSVYLQDIDMVHNKAEYGIFIGDRSNCGHGVGTITAKKCIEYGFDILKLHRIYLRVYEDNKRAISSYEKAGFRREALLKDDVYVNGKYHNIVLMGIVKDGK